MGRSPAGERVFTKVITKSAAIQPRTSPPKSYSYNFLSPRFWCVNAMYAGPHLQACLGRRFGAESLLRLPHGGRTQGCQPSGVSPTHPPEEPTNLLFGRWWHLPPGNGICDIAGLVNEVSHFPATRTAALFARFSVSALFQACFFVARCLFFS